MLTFCSTYSQIADLALALSFLKPTDSVLFKQGVALTGPYVTVLARHAVSTARVPTAHAPGGRQL